MVSFISCVRLATEANPVALLKKGRYLLSLEWSKPRN
jgi:hypothetical protein